MGFLSAKIALLINYGFGFTVRVAENNAQNTVRILWHNLAAVYVLAAREEANVIYAGKYGNTATNSTVIDTDAKTGSVIPEGSLEGTDVFTVLGCVLKGALQLPSTTSIEADTAQALQAPVRL